MNQRDMILYVFNTTYDKESWYAPLKDAINGVTAEQANYKPIGDGTNTIWENVNHLIYYKERLVAKLDGKEWTKNLDGDETFSLTEQSNDDKEWMQVVERLENVYVQLRKRLNNFSEEELYKHSFEFGLMDILLHDAYHTGQIIQIRKMQGSWPAKR